MSDAQQSRGPGAAFVEKYHAVALVLPFAVFLAITSLEPSPPESHEAPGASSGLDAEAGESKTEDRAASEEDAGLFALSYDDYPLVYTAKIALTLLAVWFVWPAFAEFPLKLSIWALVVGGLGAVAWIALAELRLESSLWAALGWEEMGQRSAFNPLAELSTNPLAAYGFLAIRFVGLVLVVPVVEELFLRGFLMRFVMDANWERIPFGQATPLALVVGTAFPMLSHPGELLAAAIWFSAVSWLMVKTKSYWDCVVAHAVTNLLLGVYVIASGSWHLM